MQTVLKCDNTILYADVMTSMEDFVVFERKLIMHI